MLFVGEERSNLAKKRGVTWSDGRLAAVPLFEALRAAGIDPTTCLFTNWFERGGKTAVLRATRAGTIIIGLGGKVQRALRKRNIAHIALVHPAARGSIRRRDRYIAHVVATLSAHDIIQISPNDLHEVA